MKNSLSNQKKGNWICFSGDHPRDSIFPQWYVNQINAEIIEIIAQLNSQGSENQNPSDYPLCIISANRNKVDMQSLIDALNEKA